VAIIAVGLALGVGSLIGAYDLMSGIEHIRHLSYLHGAGG
jgi:hypothetical protein